MMKYKDFMSECKTQVATYQRLKWTITDTNTEPTELTFFFRTIK